MKQASETEAVAESPGESRESDSIAALAAGVAHDFNNLLVSVIGNASLAQQILPPGNPAAELLDGIVKAGEQAAHLTRQMLAYSGKGKFLVEAVDLSELVSQTAAAMRPAIHPRIGLRLDLAPDLPPVRADRTQLRQLSADLVWNAAEAYGPSGGRIEVKTKSDDMDARDLGRRLATAGLEPGRYVYLEVGDRGCGMEEATKARIFEPFFSTKFTGRGLGLAAAAGIVRAHQGAIFADSAPGQGSTFTVLLPAERS